MQNADESHGMTQVRERLRIPSLGFKRENFRDDAGAAVVLGVESVPDGLASGLLAGVNPVAGLYAYMFGVASGALFTSTMFMAIQGTGAMAIIIADVDLDSSDDPTRALVTLAVLTGVVMIVAGLLKLGTYLRFVPNSVMAGFISAVGVNIVLGQIGDFTGYDSEGANRVIRAFDLLFNFWEVHLPTLTVGVITVASPPSTPSTSEKNQCPLVRSPSNNSRKPGLKIVASGRISSSQTSSTSARFPSLCACAAVIRAAKPLRPKR